MEDVLAGLAADEGRSGGESEGEGAFLEFGEGRGAEADGACARGDERKRRLGSYYSIVQARVNEMLS